MPSRTLQQGSIVWANDVPDEHGRNLKRRRILAVSPTEEIDAATTVFFVAITTKDFLVPNGMGVPLPYHRDGKCNTGLTQECVAACHWIVEMPKSSLTEIVGHCPTFQLEEVLERIADLD